MWLLWCRVLFVRGGGFSSIFVGLVVVPVFGGGLVGGLSRGFVASPKGAMAGKVGSFQSPGEKREGTI